jgi:hypothetical protein
MILMRPGGGVAYQYAEKVWGDFAPLPDVISACKSLSSSSVALSKEESEQLESHIAEVIRRHDAMLPPKKSDEGPEIAGSAAPSPCGSDACGFVPKSQRVPTETA